MEIQVNQITDGTGNIDLTTADLAHGMLRVLDQPDAIGRTAGIAY